MTFVRVPGKFGTDYILQLDQINSVSGSGNVLEIYMTGGRVGHNVIEIKATLSEFEDFLGENGIEVLRYGQRPRPKLAELHGVQP